MLCFASIIPTTPYTVRGQLGFGLDQSEAMKSVTTNHKTAMSPGLTSRGRQPSPGRTLIKNTVSLHMQQVRASPELETGQGQP